MDKQKTYSGTSQILTSLPVFGEYAIATPQKMQNIVSDIDESNHIYLVDYDQTLNACDKNDEFASTLDWQNHHRVSGLKNVIFLHEHDQLHILNYDVKKKIERFRQTKPNPKVYCWTARSLEMVADIQILLKKYKIANLFDGIIACDGKKDKAIEYIATKTAPEKIFVIDNCIRNCEKAKQIIPEKNVELYIGENLDELRTKNAKLQERNKSLEKDTRFYKIGFTLSLVIMAVMVVRQNMKQG